MTSEFRTTDSLSPVLRIVIESGAIYSIAVTAALVVFVLHSTGNWVILDMVRKMHPALCDQTS